MSEEKLATLPETGVSETTSESQAPAPAGQPTGQDQISGGDKVESTGQQPSSQEETRAKPSDFYRQRNRERQKIDSLEKTIAALAQKIDAFNAQTSVSSAPKAPQRDFNKEFYENPVQTINDLIESKIKYVEERVPKAMEEKLAKQAYQSKRQEALDLIFTSERLKKDGDDGFDRIQQILKDKGLDYVAEKDPILAAKNALEWYDFLYPKPKVTAPTNPAAPKNKGQMVSTQTGTASASLKEDNVDDLKAELGQIKQSIIKNSELAMDPKIKERVEEIKKKLSDKISKG